MVGKQRLACDRCHALKEKCIFRNTSACSRCSKLATSCATSRRKNGVGRPRKPERASTRPQAGAEFVWFGSPVGIGEQMGETQSQFEAEETNPLATTSSNPKPIRTTKPKRKPTDPKSQPKHNPTQLNDTPPRLQVQGSKPTPPPLVLTITPTTPLLLPLRPGSAPLTHRETLLLQSYLTNRRLVSRFLLSASFADAVLSHLCTTLHAAPETLLHVALACASRFASRRFVLAAQGRSAVESGEEDWGGGPRVGVGGRCGEVEIQSGGVVDAGLRAGADDDAVAPLGGDGCVWGGDGGIGGTAGARSASDGEKAVDSLGRLQLADEDAGPDGSCYVHSAKAVKVLRDVEVEAREGRMGIREVVLVLTLGLGLVTFDLLDSGLWAHEVCRFTLGLVERGYYSSRGGIKSGIWVHQAGRVFEVDGALVPLVSMDVYNCLVRRQMPVCRLEMDHDEGQRVDKYLGLCGPLLGVLFDICRVSYRLRPLGDSSQSLDAKERKEILRELEGIEDTVLEWDPRVPELFAITTSPDEVRGVQAQAWIYKTATLLIIHRLHHGFGTQDDDAYELSQTILTEIDKLYPRPSTPGGPVKNSTSQVDYRLSFPFFIAAIELDDPRERIRALDMLQSVVCQKIYPQVVDQLGQALTLVWEARDWQYCPHWFDLLSTGMPPFVLL